MLGTADIEVLHAALKDAEDELCALGNLLLIRIGKLIDDSITLKQYAYAHARAVFTSEVERGSQYLSKRQGHLDRIEFLNSL